MFCTAAVLVCALDLLYRPVSSFPPVVLVDSAPAGVSANAEAFVRRNPDAIFIITTTATFRDAQKGRRDGLQKLASILVHEEWHLRNGRDERGAYEAQLLALISMGVSDGRPIFHEVRRSMLKVLAAQKRAARKPEMVTAAR